MSDQDHSSLWESLRRREGNWVQWGRAFHQLQQQGESSLAIFEETGFTPSQQNQILVAVQVFDSLEASVAAKYAHQGSDVLYELRLLPQNQRSRVADFIHHKSMTPTEAKEVVKAMKNLLLLPALPQGFTDHPGDALAYQAWKTAKETNDPTAKTRLIAKGLQYAHSESARQSIEDLLGNLVRPKAVSVPRLPFYRYESEENLPRLFPVVGKLPLPITAIETAPNISVIEPFGVAYGQGNCGWVAIPSYQVVKNCQDGIVVLGDTNSLKALVGEHLLPSHPEDLLLLIDRSQTVWTADQYVAVAKAGELALGWYDQAPTETIYGTLVLILRPKKYFDETASQELWSIDE
jgi:hypothetical protein